MSLLERYDQPDLPPSILADQEIAETHGYFMSAMLREELKLTEQQLSEQSSPRATSGLTTYLRQLQIVKRSVNSALVSTNMRSQHGRMMLSGFDELRMATDRDAGEIKSITGDSSNDYLDEETESEPEAPSKPPQQQPDPRQRKKEDAKKRRVEDAMLLVKEKKVRDDKGNLIPTVGPFPPPRLAHRAAKVGQLFISRKTLTARTELVKEEPIDDPEEFVPATQGPSGDYDVTAHLASVLQPLTSDSLKKISESAKLNLKPSTTNEEFINAIVKTAARLGCEKACLLMDKHKIIDAVASYCHASRPDVMAHLGTNVDFLTSLPEDLRRTLGPVLGMPKDSCSVGEMWERIVAMGFCTVLTNLRQRPIRRVAQELGIQLPETTSTEKYGEAIVYTAFPRERIRYKQSKSTKKSTDVQFSILQSTVRSVGDMGFISFVVHNVSTMRRDLERHYSPEFDFGNMRWSILCMANKDSLALYLCQTGTVHCKFVISVVNVNPDDSLCNEGTQRFNSASAENDWGFNNVVKFDTLLDPAAGFWNAENDSITIEVGLVFVDFGKIAPQYPKPAKQVPKEPEERIIKSVADQLLESERLETVRKKIKAEVLKTQKEEERLRKESHQRQQKAWAQLWDNHQSEKNRILRAEKERERKEQLERKKEEDRARLVQEQIAEFRKRLTDLNDENAELANKKKQYTQESKDLRKAVETARQESASVEAEIAAVQLAIEEADAALRQKAQLIASRREALQQPIPTLDADSGSSGEEEAMEGKIKRQTMPTSLAEVEVDEHELFSNLQATLASIMGS